MKIGLSKMACGQRGQAVANIKIIGLKEDGISNLSSRFFIHRGRPSKKTGKRGGLWPVDTSQPT